MVTATTQGVKITVETAFQDQHSNFAAEHFMFSYHIVIQNLTDQVIQLVSRRWYIFDSNGTKREVEGEGVVGVQPVINPGEKYEYYSGCSLKTDIGYMKGYYIMKRMLDKNTFLVDIPAFTFTTPCRLN